MSYNLKNQDTVTRQDITNAVYKDLGLSLIESRQLVDRIFAIMSDALVDGDTVKLAKFGTFSTVDKTERKGRNILTGQDVMIKARRVLKFKASTDFTHRVNRALSSGRE